MLIFYYKVGIETGPRGRPIKYHPTTITNQAIIANPKYGVTKETVAVFRGYIGFIKTGYPDYYRKKIGLD